MRRARASAPEEAARFEAEAEGRAGGVVSELWGFMRVNKKWWLTPVILTLLLVAALVILAGTAAAPLIYTLF